MAFQFGKIQNHIGVCCGEILFFRKVWQTRRKKISVQLSPQEATHQIFQFRHNVHDRNETITILGSCVLKASVDRVSVDTLGRYVDRQSADMSTDSRSIYRPILGRYVGRDSVDISADCRSTRMSGDTLRYFTATRPTLGGYFTDTRPALRSFCQLLLLSSIFSTQVLDNLF